MIDSDKTRRGPIAPLKVLDEFVLSVPSVLSVPLVPAEDDDSNRIQILR